MSRTLRFCLAAASLLTPLSASATPPEDPPTITTIEKFSLILYDFDSAEPGSRNQRILDEYVYPSVEPGTEISIVGYSDVVGQELHNYELARARATRIASKIKGKLGSDAYRSIEALAYGEEQAPYRHDLPEGRMLSRTVVITLRTQGEVTWTE
jgi:outer membrane protein OmpA-like peptidoglycan-associated protein